MTSVLQPIVELYRQTLQPMAPFTWLGLSVSALDFAAVVRLAVAMRQFKEFQFKQYHERKLAVRRTSKGKDKAREGFEDEDESLAVHVPDVEARSFARDAAASLLVVYGGEIMSAPLLGIPPSFLVSGVFPALYAGVQAAVEWLPNVPVPTLESELPLSFLDAITRSYLLCSLIPPTVLDNANTTLSQSPWTLLFTSLITANGGFFLANTMSFFSPGPLQFTTPTELLPYGWTTTDLWAAPFITGLFAFLTHAQPFWADAHAMFAGALGAAGTHNVSDPTGEPKSPGVAPLDVETARAACAVVLMVMFATRASKNFGGLEKWMSRTGTTPKQ